MKKKFLKIFIIAALTLALPLTGMGISQLNCPCSGDDEQNQVTKTLQKTISHQGCCEEDSNPRPSRPCQCGDRFCDFILETKRLDLTPSLTDSVAFFEAIDLRGARVPLLNSTRDPAPLHPFTFIQEFLVLHTQTWRC